MKVIDSGMPDEEIWMEFFNIDLILSELLINKDIKDIVEMGFGYGTFTFPTAKLINGNLYAFDIEKEMLDIVSSKMSENKITNLILEQRDILDNGTGLADNSMDYVMLFNILHHDNPNHFFNEAYRILKPSGKIGIIHWRSDISTPRGPDLTIRPKPEQIIDWIDIQRFDIYKEPFNIEPYHYGLIISKR